MGIGDWGLGIGDWGLGPIPNPNPQSPIPNFQRLNLSQILKIIYFNFKFNLMNSSSEEENEKDRNNSEEKTKIRKINIDYKMAQNQIKLNILGIEIYFPYEPYENQILYMKKVIEALQTKGMAGLESPTGTGKTLCLLCACLGYLKHLRDELIQDKKEENGQDKQEEMNQPVIYYKFERTKLC